MLNYIATHTSMLPILIGLAVSGVCRAAPTELLTAPESLDAPKLLGEGNKPSYEDLGRIYSEGLGAAFSGKADAGHLNNLNLVLLVLAKCTHGGWIKSLFQEADDEGGKNGQGSATVVLAKETEGSDDLVWDTVEVQRAELTEVMSILDPEIKPDKFDSYTESGWWAWAFAEATLQSTGVHQAERNSYFDPAKILQTVSGVKTVRVNSASSSSDNEAIWSEYLGNVDTSPVILRSTHREGGSEGGDWFAGWTRSGEGDGRLLECVKLDTENNLNSMSWSEIRYTDLNKHVMEVVYLKDHAAFGGRPAHPKA